MRYLQDLICVDITILLTEESKEKEVTCHLGLKVDHQNGYSLSCSIFLTLNAIITEKF